MDKQSIIKALRDFGQSASNTAADTVAVPVDLIASALRAGGIDVGTPVGGSQWMAEKGLTAPVEPGVAKAFGESAGIIGPMVAAAKAPQIAKTLNQMGANASARTMANRGQRGAIDPEMLGLKINSNGSVTLLHGTTPDAADAIVNSKTMKSAGEPSVYFTTADDAGYGTGAIVEVDVDPKKLFLDDEFPSGRMDFAADAPNKFFKVLGARRIK